MRSLLRHSLAATALVAGAVVAPVYLSPVASAATLPASDLAAATSVQTQDAQAANLTVAEALAAPDGTSATVEGYVVGQPVSTDSVVTTRFPNDYALALADAPDERDTARMLYVQIPDAFRADYGLQSNPDLIGSGIAVSGAVAQYFSHDGLKSVTGFGGAEPEPEPDPEPDPGVPADYYAAAEGKTGADLEDALHGIISDSTVLSYDDVWDALKQTDEDPNNPANVVLLYSGESRGEQEHGGDVGDWNREHVWAKSHGDFGTSPGPGTDIHHLRPTDMQVNSTRGNKDFDNGGDAVPAAPGNFTDSDSWEPRDQVKGDVARMIFYMSVRYEGADGFADLEMNDQVNNGSAPAMGRLSVLLDWHAADPPDAFERNRNDVIFEDWQHNRNPFIDHPEWAGAIWN
jgi:endonuclease I